jgi:hypothetical protein
VARRTSRFRFLWFATEYFPITAGPHYRPIAGSIYRAIHVHTGQVVALKVQRVDIECPTNRYERGFYPVLQGGEGMPTLWASGVDGYWDYLAIDLLGPSLDNLYRNHGKTNMDLQSVCCIAMQVVSMFLCIFVHKADKTT